MKFSAVFVVVFLAVAVTYVSLGEARVDLEIERRACRFQCWLKCCPLGTTCGVRCQWGKKKRSVQNDYMPYPANFERYDQNNDELISKSEFLSTLKVDEESGTAALKIADQDGDAKLDRDEFDQAPFLKENEEPDN